MRSESVTETCSNAPESTALDDVPRRLSAVGRIREHVMDGEKAFSNDVCGKDFVIVLGDLFGVVSVEEEERHRARPPCADRLGAPDDRSDDVLEVRPLQRGAK